jgi:alkaline phosphatase D
LDACPLFAVERAGGKYENTINLTFKHGVKTALEYAKSGDLAAARKASNPDNAPHLSFVDHGRPRLRRRHRPQAVESEFVCIPRPIARATTPDGGPLRYRVTHRAKLWSTRDKPKLEQQVVEGNADLSV